MVEDRGVEGVPEQFPVFRAVRKVFPDWDHFNLVPLSDTSLLQNTPHAMIHYATHGNNFLNSTSTHTSPISSLTSKQSERTGLEVGSGPAEVSEDMPDSASYYLAPYSHTFLSADKIYVAFHISKGCKYYVAVTTDAPNSFDFGYVQPLSTSYSVATSRYWRKIQQEGFDEFSEFEDVYVRRFVERHVGEEYSRKLYQKIVRKWFGFPYGCRAYPQLAPYVMGQGANGQDAFLCYGGIPYDAVPMLVDDADEGVVKLYGKLLADIPSQGSLHHNKCLKEIFTPLTYMLLVIRFRNYVMKGLR